MLKCRGAVSAVVRAGARGLGFRSPLGIWTNSLASQSVNPLGCGMGEYWSVPQRWVRGSTHGAHVGGVAGAL